MADDQLTEAQGPGTQADTTPQGAAGNDTGDARNPENPGIIRNEKGQFVKGVSGNPAGKPPGTVSIVAKIKQKFLEDPEYFDEWVKKLMEDAGNRRAIMEQIDGKPQQQVDVTSGHKPLQVIVPSAVADTFKIDASTNSEAGGSDTQH